MKITDVICHVLLATNYDQSLTSSAQDNFKLILHADEGLTGIRESDVKHWLAKSYIDYSEGNTL